ncbi:cytochrome P450 71AU50-like [Primulina tabacum]|uniref:cytochrome P450 71AU50-like n=1 Tax=Primulina tabacum TaxID=48773 RepID=UPI003F5AB9A3
MDWIWTAIPAILFLYLLRLILTIGKKKRLPPGPIGIPILGHFHLLGKNPHHDLNQLARKYGPIMYLRFGYVPNIVISSPAGAKLILKTHDLIFASRPHHEASQYIGYGQTNLSFGQYGPYWRNMRKLCTLELMNNHKINQFRDMRKAEIGLLVSSLKQAAESLQTVDISARVSGLSADMICLMVFGRKHAEKDLNEKGFKAVVTEALQLGAKFNLGDYFPYLGAIDLQGLTRQMKDLSKIFDWFLEKIINEHVEKKKKENKETVDFVDTMLRIMESGEAEFEFDRRHFKAVLLDLFVAGMDTSATTVECAISELMRHPQVMKKLQQELESISGLDHMIEESHIDNFQYLDMVIKETLRLHPVIPLLLPHESMEDYMIDGFHIPRKSRVIVNVWAIGRDPNVWPDPEKFTPERFAETDVDIRGRDFRLLPFGSGRRSCPGMQLGLTAVRLMLSQLVHCFDWELPNGTVASDLDMSEHFGLVTSRKEHLLAVPIYRLHH